MATVNKVGNRLKNKYHRFCKSIACKDADFAKLSPRSDVWIIRFVEDCFDEAISTCCIFFQNSNKHSGLELGAMDCFPIMVKRLLSRTFSVLELRAQFCLEMLITVEFYANKELSDNDIPSCVKGNRVTLFSRFLSEEYDVVTLILFLHARDVVQKKFNIRLKDLSQPRIWSDNYDTTLCLQSIFNAKSGDRNNKIVGKKMKHFETGKGHDAMTGSKAVPIKLPSPLRFVADEALAEVPLVAFESGNLTAVLLTILPQVSPKVRTYMAERVNARLREEFNSAQKSSQTPLGTNKFLVEDIELSRSGSFYTSPELEVSQCKEKSVGDQSDASKYVPIYTLLNTFVNEWKRIPPSKKENLGSLKDTNESLKELNTMYEDNCLKFRAINSEVKEAERSLATCDALLLKLEKSCRRLERRWDDGFASSEEMVELQNLRTAVTSNKAERYVIFNLKIKCEFCEFNFFVTSSDSAFKQICIFCKSKRIKLQEERKCCGAL